MAQSTIKEVLPCNIKKVWERVTSLIDYSWRSDLDRIEVTGENTFTEYDKTGHFLCFTVAVRAPCTRLEFFMENGNLKGSWIGVFRDLDGKATEIEFNEEVIAKKILMKPFLNAYLKKQQKRYLEDLKKSL